MSTTTLLLLLALEIVAVTAEDNCLSHNISDSINNCCELLPKKQQTFTFSRSSHDASGVYWINEFCGDECTKAEAYCDNNNGGGWLVVQRRQDGSLDFNRTWAEYEDGFGNLTGEFWYGLKALHCLTGQGGWEMQMDIKLADGTDIFHQYNLFKVAASKDKYQLTVEGYKGNESITMASSNRMYFTTKDSDNDRYLTNCALLYGPTKPSGGWWYNKCWSMNPNSFYIHNEGAYRGYGARNVQFIDIKIRPHNCKTFNV